MAILSLSEALCFLTDILEMTSIHEKLSTNKASFLDELISLYQQKIPFQSVTVISRSDKDQHLSTIDDIKTDVFATRGGLCYDHNYFMKNLLETLGFNVCFFACDIGMHGIHDHVAVLVQNLKNTEDHHFVDVGSGNPIFRAISLDFNQVSAVYKSGHLTHKFTKEGETFSWWHRVTHKRTPSEGDVIVDGWRQFMTFTLEPREIEYFKEHMIRHYVNQGHDQEGYTFLRALRAVVYTYQKLVAIRDTSFLLEDDEGNVEKTKIKSEEEVIQLCVKYFPQFPHELIEIAIKKLQYTF